MRLGSGSFLGPTSGLNAGLVSFWKLADLTDSIGSNALTNNNSATFVAGKIGNCGNFVRASSQYFSVASNASLQVGSTDFSVSAWFNAADFTSNQEIINRLDATLNGDYDLYIDSSGILHWRVWLSTGAQFTISTAALSTATWYHAVATYTRATKTGALYLSNAAPLTASAPSNPANTAIELDIGRYGGGTYFNGKIDAVGFWSRALQAADVSLLYNSGNGIEPPF
jgi:Concanavalin A-like lectin/glucanases superfamily